MSRSSGSLPVYCPSREQLVEQLVFFDEQREHFMQQYFPYPGPERNLVSRTLSLYTAALEALLLYPAEEMLHHCVLIGSQVDLCYEAEGAKDTLILVFPGHADPDQSFISFLSPVGLQLLLEQKNAVCELIIPAGRVKVRIDGIRYADQGGTR